MDTAEAAALGEKGGYAGKMLFVDIHGTGIDTWTEPTSKYAKKFLGARGIHNWMLFNHVPIDADALDPESLLCLGAGPLNGTLFPLASRLEIGSINAMTGGYSHSNCGSDVSSEMKYAGYDHIIISGKASSPSYLFINDDPVELRDASHLWGKNQMEARNIVRDEMGDKRICAIGIGVAGENLSRIASIQGDAWHASGSMGAGAVMGSKNLKLICVRGHGSVEVNDPEKFKETVDAEWSRMELIPQHWWERNVGGYTLPLRQKTRLKNAQWHGPMYTVEEIEKLDHKYMDDHGYTGKRYGCRHCALCNHGTFYKITHGRHAGVKCKWIMYCVSLNWLGLLDPVPNAADVIRWVYLTDSLGMDDGKASPTISWAFECYQRGLLTKEDTGGKKLKWPRERNDNELIFQLLEDMAHRRGKLGELLADGAVEAAKKIAGRLSDEGKPPEYYVCSSKQGAVQMESARSQFSSTPAISIKWYARCVLATRGGMHSSHYGYGPDASTMTPEEYADMMDGKKYEEMGRKLSYNEWYTQVFSTTGGCVIPDQYNRSLGIPNPDDMATALNYATGSSFTGDSLVYGMGRKLLNIAKAINTLREGFTREHDMPIERVLEPLPPPNIPDYVDINKWNEQLDKYYDFQGWDRATGWQKKKTLIDLGLPAVALALAKEGKLK